MPVAATLDWPRIFTPAEVAAIRSAMDLPRLRVLFDVLLHTGMKYAEVRQLRDDPYRYDEVRGTLAIYSHREKKRTVVRGDRGRAAVAEFIGSGARMPGFDFNWRTSLTRAARRAGLSAHPDPPAGSSPGNPYGMGVASTRKTWESWLYALHPEWLFDIVSSQGHHDAKEVDRYGALAWSAEDLDAMRLETTGWEPLNTRLHARSPWGGRETGAARPLPWTRGTVMEIRRLHAAGADVQRIAAETGLPPRDVSECIVQGRVRMPDSSPFRSPCREVFAHRGAELIAAYEAGCGMEHLAEEAGVSYHTLRKFLVLHDVPLRGPGRIVRHSD